MLGRHVGGDAAPHHVHRAGEIEADKDAAPEEERNYFRK